MIRVSDTMLNHRWKTLFSVADRLARVRSIEDAMDVVRDGVRDIVGADALCFAQSEGDHCRFIAEDSIAPLWEGQAFLKSERIAGWVMQHDEAAIIPDIHADERVVPDQYSDSFVKSLAIMPVRAGPVPAALAAYWGHSGKPDPASIQSLRMLASLLGAAIYNITLQSSFALINRTGAAVAAERELEPLVQKVTDAGVELTGAQFGAFFYNCLDEQGESYTLYSLSGTAPEVFAHFPMPRNTALFAPTFAGLGVTRSDDIRLDPRYGHNAPIKGVPEGHPVVASYMAVPIVARSGEVHGALFFGHRETARFTPEHEEVALGLAGHAAVAIDNARLHQQSERELAARRAAEVDLRASNRRFRAAVEAVQGVLWTALPDGGLDGDQPGWAALTGQTPEEYRDFGWLEAVHPDDRDATLAAWCSIVAEGGHYQFEHRLRRWDGSFRHYSIRAVPIYDEAGEVEQWVGVHSDINDQREAEEALRDLNATLERRIDARTQEIQAAFTRLEESERRFRILVDGVTDYAIYMLDPDGHITNWNAGAERIKGFSSEEILGSHVSTFYTDQDRAAGLPRAVLETAARVGRSDAEGWRMRKDGSLFWASVVIDAIHDEQGDLIGFAKITRDLTDKRAVEEQLRQSQKMEAVGQLTGGIAHDFNNLLTIISGNLELAARAVGGDPETDRAARAIANAVKGAERAAALTQRLLAFARRQPLSPKPLDINRLVDGMSDLLNRSLGETVMLKVVPSAERWRVEIDPNQLENALINLAVNARDAMPDGGTLTIESYNVQLGDAHRCSHEDVPPGDYVVLAVSDTGTGIPAEHLERVFEPFFTTKEVGRGTGLGLSQVYGFVKQSGGHVDVYSEEGCGTTVRLYLPRYAGVFVEPEASSAPPATDPAAQGETVLVVEDDAEVRALSTQMLRECGYRVLEAADGASALALLEAEAGIDLLFTDVVMPGMSGKELADAAAAMRPDLKILFASGYTRNAIAAEGRLDPSVSLLSKPFTSDQLARRVRALLDGEEGGTARN